MSQLKPTPFAGRVAYNGFVFGSPGCPSPNLRLSGTPEYDEAGRALVRIRYVLEISAIYAESEADEGEHLAGVRAQLSAAHGTLELDDLGISPLTADDLRPQLLSFAPVTGAQAWQVEWRCEFCVRSTALAAARHFWLALNYSSTFTLNDRGLTTRTLLGYAQILPVLADTPGVRPRTADEVRDQLHFATPAGFRRSGSRWTLAANAARVDFEVVDTQLESEPFPPGIVAAELEYRVEHAPGGARIAASLSGWLETAADAPPALAAVRFLELAHDKLRRLEHSPGARPGLAVPSRFAVRRQLFTARTHFTLEVHVVRRVRDLLAAAGVWAPLPEADERLWRAALARLWENRGAAGLRVSPRENVVIDLADRPTRTASLGETAPRRTVASAVPAALNWTPHITEETSWLEYQVRLRADREENISAHTLARTVHSAAAPPPNGSGVGAPFAQAGGLPGQVYETHGPPLQTITLSGQALRLRYVPVAPALARVGSRPVRELRRMEERELVTHFGAEPVHGLRWSLVYQVDGYIANLEPPAGPMGE